MTNETVETSDRHSPLAAIFRAVAPWMLLATVMRTFGIVSLPLGAPLLFGSALALFIAFLIACQKAIQFTGGSVAFAGARLRDRIMFGKDILWRVALFGLLTHYLAAFLGLTAIYRVPLVYGFDGLAFNRFQDFLLVWSVLIGLLTFLMVFDKARSQPASLLGAGRILARHWRYLLVSVLILIPALALMNILQLAIGPLIRDLFSPFGSTALTAAVTIVYLFVFACIRIVGVVVVLTIALKRSWRNA